jgi:hypothetical protein
MLTAEQAGEWQSAAMWCAQRGLNGKDGEPLPAMLSAAVYQEIYEYPEEFQADVRTAKYALAMGTIQDE